MKAVVGMDSNAKGKAVIQELANSLLLVRMNRKAPDWSGIPSSFVLRHFFLLVSIRVHWWLENRKIVLTPFRAFC
jgi:hypothetical protein